MSTAKNDNRLLNEKVAVITGAGQGLGKALARVFAREGAKVLAVDYSGMQSTTAAEIGSSVLPFHADLRHEDEIAAMFAYAVEKFGRVDVLVNNAATQAGVTPEVTAEEYEELTAVNLRGLLFCCKHAVRVMVRGGGGSIINISTIGALGTERRASMVYTAAKAAVHSLTKSYAVHYGAQGIRVNAVATGLIATERSANYSDAWKQEIRTKGVMGRAATMEEPAEVAAFLASDRASFVTGAIIPVDGGWSAQLA